MAKITNKINKAGVLANAAGAVQVAAQKAKKPSKFRALIQWKKKQIIAVWNWIRKVDKLLFFNIILLALVAAMSFVMLTQVRNVNKQNNAKYVSKQDASEQIASRPTIVVSRGSYDGSVMPNPKNMITVVSLPIRPFVPQPIVRKRIIGSLLVDGNGRSRIPEMTTISGDLILQNMRAYTLPCGTKIDGDLLLRNVALLRWCGSFEIAGNIYVSSDSSFGPIPRNARLGGQVIF